MKGSQIAEQIMGEYYEKKRWAKFVKSKKDAERERERRRIIYEQFENRENEDNIY